VDQLDTLKEAFMVFDLNGSGRINQSDMNSLLALLGLKPATIGHCSNSDEEVEFLDFLRQVSVQSTRRGSFLTDTDLRRTFDQHDTQRKGYLTRADLRRLMKALGDADVTEADLSQMLVEADVDLDARVSYDEFHKVMRKRVHY